MNDETHGFHILRGQHVIVIKAFEDSDSSYFKYAIPLNHDNQTPILLEINGDFLSYQVNTEKNHNSVIKFELPSMNKDEKITIKFEYWVLTKNKKYEKLPKKIQIPLPKKLTKSQKKWLSSTKSVQSDNIFIRVAARLIQGFSDDPLWFIKKVMYWSAYHGILFNVLKKFLVRHPFLHRIFLSDIFGYKLEDALSTLIFGGLCVGQANLQAALLRARGIPARVVIATSMFYGKEEWMDSQHYFIEFFYPNFGWVRAQSGSMPYPSRDSIILRIVTPEEENIAGNGLSKNGGTPNWFWFSNNKIFFDIPPQEYISYKPPKSKTIGFPALRGWREKKLQIPNEFVQDISSLTENLWRLNKKISKKQNKKIPKEAINKHKQAIKHLKQSEYKKYIKEIKKVEEIYKKILS